MQSILMVGALIISPLIIVLIPVLLRLLATLLWHGTCHGAKKGMAIIRANKSAPKDFALYLGTATGKLQDRNHIAGIPKGQKVYLPLRDAAKNIFIFGGIGSGKTTAIINGLLSDLLRQDCGGLIYDIKGDFKGNVYHYAGLHNRPINTIGTAADQYALNLIDGLNPSVAASFLKSALVLGAAGNNKSDEFWLATGTALCKAGLGILSFCPGCYDLYYLQQFITNPAAKSTYLAQAANAQKNVKQERYYQSYIQYFDTFETYDDKVKTGVVATLQQILAAFGDPDIQDTFCTPGKTRPVVNMMDILDGSVFLLDLPTSTGGVDVKTIYTLVKLRFFNLVQQRPVNKEWNQTRPVFFLCDEYQDAVSAAGGGVLSDRNFWDKSRAANCIGIVSTQTVQGWIAAIGDKDTALTLLGNFRQKLCLQVEDPATENYLKNIAGKSEVERETYNSGSGRTESDALLRPGSSNDHTGKSVSLQLRDVIDSQLIRGLQLNQSISLLNINGLAQDDILQHRQEFV